MKIYNDLVRQLDSSGAHYSQDLSEVDLSDPEDVKVTANNPEGDVLVHLGSENYLDRYKIYVTHVRAWRQQFDKLESVDLRYDRQIIVNPDLQGAMKQPPLPAYAAKKAIAAGVKPAALIGRMTTVAKPPATITATTVDKVSVKPVAKKKNVRQGRHKASVKKVSAKTKVASALTTSAANTKSATDAHGKTPSAVPPTTSGVPQTAKKPSPAIAKGQESQ
jgi:cell division protein FtsQ